MQGARLVEMVTDKETGKEGSIRHRPVFCASWN
jgi:hypothetical protein